MPSGTKWHFKLGKEAFQRSIQEHWRQNAQRQLTAECEHKHFGADALSCFKHEFFETHVCVPPKKNKNMNLCVFV